MRRQIENGKICWVDLVEPSEKEFNSLLEEFHFHQKDLQEARKLSHFSRFELRPGYMFLVVNTPVFDADERSTFSAEVDIFVAENKLVTIHQKRVHLLDNFYQEIKKNEEFKLNNFERGIPYLLHSLMSALIDSSFPKLDHILEKIEAAEERIFNGEERAMVYELSALQRDLSGFRQVVKPQVHLYSPQTLHGEFSSPLFKAVFRGIQTKLERTWDMLEVLQEKVNSLSATNNTLLTHKLNEFIKLLTLLGALFIPLGLIANAMIFSSPSTTASGKIIFWALVLLMLLVDLFIFWNYRLRKLL